MKFNCLFEQSGTFKNVFKSFGHQAFDYDILNDYGETDFQIDLFGEIERTYSNIIKYGLDKSMWLGYSIFDKMQSDKDFIIAFFPCTYFSDMNEMIFKTFNNTRKSDSVGIEKTIKRIKERAYYFELFLKFCFVCQELKIPTIIENPAGIKGARTYLQLYSPYRPSYTESDRTLYGDIFRKPTDYYAINFNMQEKFMMYDEEINKKAIKSRIRKVSKEQDEKSQLKRSEITPRYADNFYKRFLQGRI